MNALIAPENRKRENIVVLLCKIFCIGILLQFFANTFATFILGRDGSAATLFWLWKEFFVLAASGYAMYRIRKKKEWKNKEPMRYMTGIFLILSIYMIAVTLGKGLSIMDFIKARKYDTIGFMIFAALYYVAPAVSDATWEKLIKRLLQGIKWLLVGALLWYVVLLLKPGFLKLFGYSTMNIE